MQQTNKTKNKNSIYRNFLELVLVGSVTGIFSGVIVTFFNLLIHEGEELSKNAYAYVRNNPAFIPLLLATLVAGAFFIGVLTSLSRVVRGGGVPQAEGASRGIVPLKWWRDLLLMFATTLAGVFMGLSVGAEGPSVLIGACSGDGVSLGLKRNQMIRKYQITGGACAGLAVAMNAPLMGMAFAFEEAHKRFTPEVFICAFTSVIFGMLTRYTLYGLMGKTVVNAFANYVLHELPLKNYPFVILAGVACGVLGVLFYKLCFGMRKLFRKIGGKNDLQIQCKRITLAVLLGGLVSLVCVQVMGGGHALVEHLGTLGGTRESSLPSMFGLPIVWVILFVLCLKFLMMSVNVGAGLPCGILIPMFAIGACIGALLNEGWALLGMDEQYFDIMIMISMAAFFTAVVRAPLTSIIMVCEFTGSFAPLLPAIIGVFIGYIIGEFSRTDGIYETLLELYEQDAGLHEREVSEVFTLVVQPYSLADKREVRDVLWPSKTKVKEIHRGEEVILPDGATQLFAGDILIIVCKTAEPQKTKDELSHIIA